MHWGFFLSPSLVSLVGEADLPEPPSCQPAPFLKRSVGGKCRTLLCPRGNPPSLKPQPCCPRDRAALRALPAASALHQPNPPATGLLQHQPFQSCTHTLPSTKPSSPLYMLTPASSPSSSSSCDCFLPEHSSSHTPCSWQIPLCHLTTTTILSPSCISTHCTP